MNRIGLVKRLQIGGAIVSFLCLALVFLASQSLNPGMVLTIVLLIGLAGVSATSTILVKKAEDEVLDRYYWYEQIIDLWENPLSITDMDMNWTFVNKTVEGLLGKPRSEVIGKQCHNWGANICKTENCGIHCLRNGKDKTFFHQWDTDFRVNTNYLTNRKGDKVGHIEIVTNVHAQKQLAQLIKKARQTASSVAAGSRELTRSAQTLSTGATEQAASIEEISSSLSEVGAQTKTNSENAEQAKTLSNETRDIVQQGNKQMEVMVDSMNKINETSAEVTKVIKVIDEIAFQTNLLALNAAVEAARAGKYGKGFAVVAEEVRALAGRSAEAAKDTTELIDKSIKGVEEGVKNADETATILSGIVTSMEKMNDLVSEIASSSIEQNTSIGEVNTSLNQVNTVVQQNASISEENASASDELKSEVDRLLGLTEGIQITEDIGEEDTYQGESMADASVIDPIHHIESSHTNVASPGRMITLEDDNYGKY